MKKIVGLICILLLLTAGSSFAAAKVTNIELTWQDGFTVAHVDVQGAVRFSHQTVAAKDGRPFRVIVDILSATHGIGQKNFADLPSCPITRIRTSQFAVSPEKVVRLVFDMKQETVYRVDSDDHSVSVYFPDKGGTAFAAWSSANEVGRHQAAPEQPKLAQASEGPSAGPAEPTHKSAAELNKSIADDHLASLQPKTTATAAPSHKPTVTSSAPTHSKTAAAEPTSPAKTPATSAKTTAGPKKPASTKPTLAATSPQGPSKPTTPTASTLKSEPTPSHKVTKATPSHKVTEPTSSHNATKLSSTPTTPGKKSTVGPTSKPTMASSNTEPTANEPLAAANKTATPTPSAGKKGLVAASELSQDNSKPTSRFRRSPARSGEIKGTLVAEFPKRLVIKYSTGERRDPFATLIDETKEYNNPVEHRIPNVDGLHLVGIIQSQAGNSALFEDKDGYGYILKEGDKVQKGYVLRVRDDRVYFQIFEYGWSRTVALNLEKD